jgi:hypothetical protein
MIVKNKKVQLNYSNEYHIFKRGKTSYTKPNI